MLQQMLESWQENPELCKNIIGHDSESNDLTVQNKSKKLNDTGNYKNSNC